MTGSWLRTSCRPWEAWSSVTGRLRQLCHLEKLPTQAQSSHPHPNAILSFPPGATRKRMGWGCEVSYTLVFFIFDRNLVSTHVVYTIFDRRQSINKHSHQSIHMYAEKLRHFEEPANNLRFTRLKDEVLNKTCLNFLFVCDDN